MQTSLDDAARASAVNFISPIGYRSSSSTCGYCHRKKNGHSYYCRARSMSPLGYEAVINRCYRRSGGLLYRPNQRDSCCPHYSLRLDSSKIRLSRDQRQAINRFNKFITGESYAKEAARRYPRSREEARKRDSEFDLVQRIHESETTYLKQPPEPAHSFTVTLEPDDFTEEKFQVFENYQQRVHHEESWEITRDGFRRFLCSSPVQRQVIQQPNGQPMKLGSYHQCYRLDGKLVAIGVLDLLPHCVSAVYFLYHESIHKWSPGKLGALREITLAIEGGYKWWYPGFYINTCPKMKYKIDFSPQQILNPNNMQWEDLTDTLLAKFDGQGYLDFSKPDGFSFKDQPQPRSATPTGKNTPANDAAADEEAKKGESEEEESDEEEGEESVLTSSMPGIMSMEEIQSFNFDQVMVRLNNGYFRAGELFEWQDDDLTNERSPKYMVAEMVSTFGPEIMRTICLDFRRFG
ncbi:arginine-tRNA-protein transferase [Xylariomycetidae sp. FL0641]|nr:arginine-tRNA-protein transferase [Xylariomycetidae sp. FL0641]